MREPTDDQLNELEKELRRAMPDYLARSPRPGETQSLLLSLQEEFNTLKEEPSAFPAVPAGAPSLYRLVRSQLRLYSRSFWLAGLLLLVLLLTLGSSVRFLGPGGLYSLLLPVLLFSGMAYSLRASNGAMRLLESITPYPPVLLLLGRWVIVLGLTVLLGAAGSLAVSFEEAPVPALEFLLGWLTPLVFAGGLLGWLLLWRGSTTALTVSFVGWAVQMTAVKAWTAGIPSWGLDGMALQGSFLAAGLLLAAAALVKATRLQPPSAPGGAR